MTTAQIFQNFWDNFELPSTLDCKFFEIMWILSKTFWIQQLDSRNLFQDRQFIHRLPFQETSIKLKRNCFSCGAFILMVHLWTLNICLKCWTFRRLKKHIVLPSDKWDNDLLSRLDPVINLPELEFRCHDQYSIWSWKGKHIPKNFSNAVGGTKSFENWHVFCKVFFVFTLKINLRWKFIYSKVLLIF